MQDKLRKPPPGGGVGRREAFSNVATRNKPSHPPAELADALVGFSKRLSQVGEGVRQDLARKLVGDLVIVDRGHDGAALAFSLELMKEGGDLDEVQKASEIAAGPQPVGWKRELIREGNDHGKCLKKPLSVPVLPQDGVCLFS